jgi:hypothetical protein
MYKALGAVVSTEVSSVPCRLGLRQTSQPLHAFEGCIMVYAIVQTSVHCLSQRRGPSTWSDATVHGPVGDRKLGTTNIAPKVIVKFFFEAFA